MTIANLVAQEFRTDTFSFNTNFDYAYDELGYQDRISRGSLSSTNSSVVWTSPKDAKGTLTGTATGTGSDQVQISGSFVPCSTYTILNQGTFEYSVDAVVGSYTIDKRDDTGSFISNLYGSHWWQLPRTKPADFLYLWWRGSRLLGAIRPATLRICGSIRPGRCHC